MYCINCAKEIRDNSNYCIYCGELVSDDKTLLPVYRSNSTHVAIGAVCGIVLMILSFAGGIFLVANDYNNDTLIVSVLAGIIMLSILPSLVLYLNRQRSYGKGFMWGTIGFYFLLVLILVSMFFSY